MKTSILKRTWFWVTVGIVLVVCVIYAMVRGAAPRSGANQMAVDDAIRASVTVPGAMMPGMPAQQAVPAAAMMKASAGTQTNSPASPQDASWSASQASRASRMIITTADISLEVSDIDGTYRRIRDIAARSNGYTTNSNVNYSEGRKIGTITIRLPMRGYEQALEAIRKLGKLVTNSETGQDVTEEFVDLQSRLRNLRVEEAAFQRIMGGAKKIPDVLNVQQQLSRVRGQIEEAMGRARYLENQVSLCTITVTFSEPVPSVTKIVDWDVLRSASGAFNALKAVCRAVVTLIVWILIFVLPLGLAAFVVYRIVKTWRR